MTLASARQARHPWVCRCKPQGRGPGGHHQAAGPRLLTHSKSRLVLRSHQGVGSGEHQPGPPLALSEQDTSVSIRPSQGRRTLQPQAEVAGQDGLAVRAGAQPVATGVGDELARPGPADGHAGRR